MKATDTVRADVAAAARRLAAEGLVVGTGGNVSLAVGGTTWVTASGIDLAECASGDVVAVDAPAGGEGEASSDAVGTPTSELALHLGVRADTGAAAVVHVHAPFSTAVACVLEELPVLHYQQLLLGGAIRVAPYATFGTPELAASVREALAGRSGVLMANHGAVTIGDSLDQAVERAVLLEWLAALHHRASVLGPPRLLTEEQQADVIRAALARGYGGTR
ncbi:class II aldolase/adducin family protein [Nocardioides acrostichi]|uniref:class II aldolase/adducin family protein n=1 Tax=Nocardioides acrostichi TaxID=2784339 RepID=UPI001A9C4342|nr:class II aldolase/adducin family protein [Nocardioides acrostichi]